MSFSTRQERCGGSCRHREPEACAQRGLHRFAQVAAGEHRRSDLGDHGGEAVAVSSSVGKRYETQGTMAPALNISSEALSACSSM